MQNLDFIEENTIHKSFVENFKYQTKRKGAVALYHTILAIHPKDRAAVTKEMLLDLKDKYIELRGLQNAVILAKVHTSEESIHWHFMIGGNEYKSKKRLRMSQTKMKQLLRDFESYHEKAYPELQHSLIHLSRPERAKRDIKAEDANRRREAEYSLNKRYTEEGKNRKTQKEITRGMVNELFDQSQSLDDLVLLIQNSPQLKIYTFRGNLKGVIYGRKYRFTTLGIDQEKIKKLERIEERLKQLSLLKEVYKGKDKGRSR